jgi:hypothetical protein
MNEMKIDDEIRDRLERSLLSVSPPPTQVEPVVDRARRLRRRRRAVGVLVAAVGVVALSAPLVVLAPLGGGDEEASRATGSKLVRLVVSARIPIARGLTDVATGLGGVWVTGAGGIVRVDPATDEVVAEIVVPGTGDYSQIAVGEGSVWVTAPELRPDGSRGNLVRIDPDTNDVAATIHLGGPIGGVAVGGGSVWVTLPEDVASTVFRVDPATDQVVDTVRVGVGVGSVIFGEGSVWANHEFDVGSVTRIDPASGGVAGTLDVPIVQAAGGGSLWGASGDAVQRIDPGSGAVQEAIPIDRAQDVAIDGSDVWVLVSPRSSDPTLFYPIAGTAALRLIDAATNHVVGEPAALDDLQPIAIAAGEDGAWVADYDAGMLTRIEVVR